MLSFVHFVVDDLTAAPNIIHETISDVTRICSSVGGDFSASSWCLLSDLEKGTASVLITPADETLILADSEVGVLELRARNRFAAGWLHAGVNAADFDPESTPYIVDDPAEVWPGDFRRIYARCAGLPWEVAVTGRLIIREFSESEEDLRFIQSLGKSSESGKFLSLSFDRPDDIADPRGTIRDLLHAYIRNVYHLYEFGNWAVCLRETGTVIGIAGLSFPDPVFPDIYEDRLSVPYSETSCNIAGDPVPELGYYISESFRGNGFAYESCSAILDLGFRLFDFVRIDAIVDAGNISSMSLLSKLGFQPAEVPAPRLSVPVDFNPEVSHSYQTEPLCTIPVSMPSALPSHVLRRTLRRRSS
ncbi:MAG: GNAT family N-acetyltransferase [Lachnospiraceae bacterium]|jgi:RimJ/RimL family protein N-acetyltransferase